MDSATWDILNIQEFKARCKVGIMKALGKSLVIWDIPPG